MPDTGMPAPLVLPDADVPEMDFAGLRAQYAALREEIAPRIARVFEHGRFVLGPEIDELEADLTAFCGARHAIAISSGTDALIAPLLASKIGPGDAVFVPSFTFTATAEVVLLLGATPVFVDVDRRTFNIDTTDLTSRIETVKAEGSVTPRAIIAVDLFGLPAGYDSLNSIAQAEDLLLIADAAQSFGATYHGRKVGALAPVTTTSFYPAKPLGCYGDGGAVFTDDDELAEILRSVRVHGQGPVQYDVERIGINGRLDSLQAAVLLAKLPAFADELTARNKLADFYDSRLSNIVSTPLRVDGCTSSWAQYSILVDDRDGVRGRLQEAGVPSAIYYPKPMHLQPAYVAHGGGAGSLPVSEELCGRIMSLPMHGYMDADVAARITDAVGEAVAGS